MGINMYRYANCCIGRPTLLRDQYGRTYRGTVERVTPNGLYFRAPGLSVGYFPFWAITSLFLLSIPFWFY